MVRHRITSRTILDDATKHLGEDWKPYIPGPDQALDIFTNRSAREVAVTKREWAIYQARNAYSHKRYEQEKDSVDWRYNPIGNGPGRVRTRLRPGSSRYKDV